MPAIHPERLKGQVGAVTAHFDEPPAFLRALHDLLEFYADHTHRPGQSGAPAPLIPTYNAPPPLLRQLGRSLAPLAAERPAAAIALCDALWEDSHLECRLLAADLLGSLPALPPDPVLARLSSWAQPKLEQRLLSSLLTAGTRHLRREAFEAYQEQLLEWLKSAEPPFKALGLQALHPVVNDPEFPHLPRVFRWLAPLTQRAPSELRPDLLKVIQALARRSPQETAFHLRQAQEVTQEPVPAWLIRRTMDLFPMEIQADLRAALAQE